MLLRFTQAYDPRVLADQPELARDLMVDRGGLRLHPGQENIPVVVDHTMERRVGVVREMFTDTDTDGRRWNFASVTLDPNPPEWLKRGTAVSWGYKAFGTRDAFWGSNTKHITGAFIEEISVLLFKKPAEPLARVLWIDKESPAAAASTSNRAAAGEPVYEYRPPVWDKLERIVGYRVTDGNQEQAFLDANRSPLDRLYDQHMKAPKACTCGGSVCIGARSLGNGHVLGARWLESADPPAARRGSHR